MEILGIIALVLLTLVGYSSGVTLASRKQPFLPTLLDLVLVSILWIVIFWLRGELENRWLMFAIGLGLGILVGYIATAIRLRKKGTKLELPKSEVPAHARDKAVKNQEENIIKRLWFRWTGFAAVMGNV